MNPVHSKLRDSNEPSKDWTYHSIHRAKNEQDLSNAEGLTLLLNRLFHVSEGKKVIWSKNRLGLHDELLSMLFCLEVKCHDAIHIQMIQLNAVLSIHYKKFLSNPKWIPCPNNFNISSLAKLYVTMLILKLMANW